MNAVFDELAETIFMNINASGLTVMYVAFDNGWIGAGLHFESSDTIIVNVILLEIALFCVCVLDIMNCSCSAANI